MKLNTIGVMFVARPEIFVNKTVIISGFYMKGCVFRNCVIVSHNDNWAMVECELDAETVAPPPWDSRYHASQGRSCKTVGK